MNKNRIALLSSILASTIFCSWVSYNNTTKCDEVFRSNVEALTDDAEYYISGMKLEHHDILNQDVSQLVRKAGVSIAHDSITGIYSYTVGADGTITYTSTSQVVCVKYYCENAAPRKKCDTREEGIFTIKKDTGKSAFFPKTMYQQGWNDID